MPAPAWLAESLLVLLRWLHTLAAVALLGWIVTWLLLPAGAATVGAGVAAARRFKEVSDVTLLVFLASGAILSFDRLSRGQGTVYALLLGAKVLLAVVTYQYAARWRREGLPPWSPRALIALGCGSGAILLAAVLKTLSAP